MSSVFAQENDLNQRPKIGLVLGGGGARGAAHVGVLKVLEELRIPVDYVVGTSMGSIVGGLYASGMSPQEIERELGTMDWDELFTDDSPREDLSFHRKRDDDFYAFKAKLGFNGGKVEFPLAYIRGQKFDLELNRLTYRVADIHNFDALPIPYRAVATNLGTGKQVVLSSGNLARSIRASMAVPAAFDPVEIDGVLLVDGGLANNVPVSVARDMGADIVIVSSIGEGLAGNEEIKDALGITGQLAGYLFTINSEPQLESLTDNDVLLNPKLGDIGGASFDRVMETIPAGETAAREKTYQLNRYALTPEQYANHVSARQAPSADARIVDLVRVENQSQVRDEIIAEKISIQPGDLFNSEQLDTDIGHIYGLDIFESVRYSFLEQNGQDELLVTAREKGWGPGYLQFGLAFADDFESSTHTRFGMLYTRTELNSLMGEWRVGGQVGSEPGIFTSIHQPLDNKLRYFVTGSVGTNRDEISEYSLDGEELTRSHVTSVFVEVSGGREFGTWGEGRVGLRRSSGDQQIVVGQPEPDQDFDRGTAYLRLTDDKMDNLYFPNNGHLGKLKYSINRESIGSDFDYDQVEASYVHAFSWRSHTFIGSIAIGTTKEDNAPIEARYQLGGFLRLSGLHNRELNGQHSTMATLVYMRRFTDFQFLQSYIGASVEVGNVWRTWDEVSLDDAILAGSVFLGFDTPIGPLYLSYGHTDTDRDNFSVYLGPRFTF